jgi:hypothetical protein
MSWDRTWRLPKSRLKLETIKDAATKVAADYAGVTAEVEKDGEDILCLFIVPTPEGGEELEIELSVYDLGSDGHVLSLEADAGDNNRVWDDASQLAEDLADLLDAVELEL